MRKIAVAPLAAALAVIVTACSSGGSEAKAPMELSAGSGDTMASCLAFDPQVLADMPVAFEGTATSVEGEQVTLEVDRWFKGGDADEVILKAPAGLEALTGGVDFSEGQQYLISATDGQVNYCGFSGEATAELEAGFEQAFGS